MSNKPPSPRCFLVLEHSLEVIELIREPLKRIKSANRDLGLQIERAVTSTPLNLAEGQRRRGRDRIQHYRIASSSADEVHIALRISVAWRYVEKEEVAEVIDVLDRMLAMLFRITEK